MGRLTGLPFCDALELERRRVARNTRNMNKRAASGKTPVMRIRHWWGMEWHELLSMLHAQGLNHEQCATAMGYKNPSGLTRLLYRNPGRDPWDMHRTIPAQYFVDTGEAFPVAVRRLIAEGKTKSEAMTIIGYARKSNVAFDRAMVEYGVEDKFVHAYDPSRPRTSRWARILELRAGAPHKVRSKRPGKSSEERLPHPWVAIIKREARAGEDRKKAKEKA